MANISFNMEMPDKNFKAVYQYYETGGGGVTFYIGRKKVQFTETEVVDLLTWLSARVGGKETNIKTTDKVLETRVATPEPEDDTVAQEARRGIIDMSGKLSSPRKITVKT